MLVAYFEMLPRDDGLDSEAVLNYLALGSGYLVEHTRDVFAFDGDLDGAFLDLLRALFSISRGEVFHVAQLQFRMGILHPPKLGDLRETTCKIGVAMYIISVMTEIAVM